jgi:MFS transporter, DHA2 family, multidrug resistance protein
VMLSLYIRGFALGILFPPLSAVSLSEISREKMGQASSISNVIRQLAGSFGVAILATMLTTRVTYHTQMYAQSVDPQSATYKTVLAKTTTYVQTHAGSAPATAQSQAKTLLVQQLSKEAYIQGIDDDFLIAGVITLLGGIPLFWLHTKKRSTKNEKTAIHE